MSEEESELQVSDIVWASAKRSIFWPAQVIEADVNGTFFTVHFYGEDTVETIKNPNKILPFCHPSHEQFISIGRKQHNIDKKLQFNKGLAAADREMKSRKDKTQVPLRRSPRKVTQPTSVGHVISCLGTSKVSEGSARGITKVKSNGKGVKLQNFIKRTLLNKGSVTDSPEMAATRRSPRKKTKSRSEEIVEELESPQEQSCTSRKRGSPETEEGASKVGKTAGSKKHKTEEQRKGTEANVDQNKEQSSSKVSPLRCGKTNRKNKKAKSSSSGKGNTERGSKNEDVNCGKVVILKLEYISDTEVAQVSSGQCACLEGKTTNTKKKTRNNSCHKDKGKNSRWKHVDCVGTRTVEGTKLDQQHSCQNQEDKEMAENKGSDKDKEYTTGADSPPNSDSSSDDDDDLPEAFSLSQEPCSPGPFALYDIVWAKYQREPFWPSQILKISRKKKLKKYYVKFLCDPCNHLIHIQEKNLFPFSSNQRQAFLEASTARPNFSEAVTMAEDLVNRKGLGKSFEEEHEVDDYELVENASDEEEADDEQEDQEDLAAPVVKRRSSREKIQVSRYSDILTYVREALPTLKSIHEGKRTSERHQTYIHGREREKDKLKLRAGFGPIGNAHLQDQIMELLLSFHQEVTKEKQYSAIKYVSDVWLPEAIIFAIQRKDGVDRERAEEMYLTGSRVAVTQADVEQFTHNLKGKTLTDEDREACRRRAERALARETGAVL